MSTLLKIRKMSKSFPGTRALDAVDLDIEAGEVHALVGQNGSGKSTLIKVLSGYHAPELDSSVEVGGVPVILHDPAASRRAGFRFVHQDLGLVRDLSVVENLAFGRGFATGRGARIKWNDERRKAERMLDSLGYDFDVRADVSDLSAAQRTGVAIARALWDWEGGEARVLVLDEPTASLPKPEVEVLFQVIRRVQERGLAVLYVSHRLDEVFAIGDHVTVLRDGRCVGTFDVDALDERELISLMIGREVPRPPRHAERSDLPVVLDARALSGTVLDDVDLVARGGEVLGIAGLTGSGREEILQLLFGAAPRRGSVTVDGTEVGPDSPKKAMKAGVALVPADRHRHGALLALTIRENATLTDLRRHVGHAWAIRKRIELAEVRGWLTSLDVRPPRPEAPLASLSGGNQQKVVIAKWLRLEPRVLLLDEPTQGIDVEAKATIHNLVREAARSGAAVVIASSDDEELYETCDRVLVLRGGRRVAELLRAEMTVADIGHLCLDESHRAVRRGMAAPA
jgi:ribose transport system ATP-binding protein